MPPTHTPTHSVFYCMKFTTIYNKTLLSFLKSSDLPIVHIFCYTLVTLCSQSVPCLTDYMDSSSTGFFFFLLSVILFYFTFDSFLFKRQEVLVKFSVWLFINLFINVITPVEITTSSASETRFLS